MVGLGYLGSKQKMPNAKVGSGNARICGASRTLYSELVSGGRKTFSSIHCGQLRNMSGELIAFASALDFPLRQVFHLDLMIAVGTTWGADIFILWYKVKCFLVIPVNHPHSL
jgi:hypothetical protein